MSIKLTDPGCAFSLLSVIDLHLPAQDCIIYPRAHSTLSFRIQGDAIITWQGQSHHIETNSVLFVPAGCSYRIHSQQEVVLCINLNIPNSEQMQPEFFSLQNAAVLSEAFQSIYRTWGLKRPGYYHKCMSLLYSILSQLDKQCSSVYHSPAFLSIKYAINYMHEHFTDQEMSVSSLCHIANLSDTQFRRNFYEVYQTTPVKYLQLLRIDYAADLLINSSLSIEEISSMSGFSDSKYFCFVFKKLKGCPPSSFRSGL
ncbi:MAG: helix-turn-helix transcriptional regulator [Oscillospiraceae bacterium]|nr:helix-turn-helix transcriptional regulator [Oscillospiraceae bacterium]